MITVRTRLLRIMWIKFGVNIDPACDDRRKWSKKYMPCYVCNSRGDQKSFGSGVLQCSQTQEWPAFENILLRSHAQITEI